MPDAAASIEAGRRAYAAGDWRTTFAELSRAREAAPLAAADIGLLARSAWLLWRVQDSLQLSEEALSDGNGWVAGEGFYQLGEIRRLRGDHAGARAAFDAARLSGVDPQPGAALLALREGRVDEAWTALTSALEDRDRVARARLLRAGVEVAIEAGRPADAASLCRELRETADDYASRGFAARADHAEGMLAVAEGDGDRACAALQSAAAAFRRDRQPYETAQALLHRSMQTAAAICMIHRTRPPDRLS